jgi:hypothetical protein
MRMQVAQRVLPSFNPGRASQRQSPIGSQ